MTKKVFLGGTANNSTWRKDLILLLDSTTKVSYFNPVVEDWNEQAQQEEIRQRQDFIHYAKRC